MKKRKGRQTPTVWITLPHRKKTEDGVLACEYYKETGRTPQKWQENLLNDMLAKNRKGLWLYTRYAYSLPRRNGKSEILLMRELYGLKKGEKILHTAHLTTTSSSAAAHLAAALDHAGYKEVQRIKKNQIYTRHYTYRKQLGLEVITLLGEGQGSVSFRTRTSRGGLGEGYDVLIIDEAQEYETEQDNTLKFIITDSQNPQMIMCGTPPTAVSKGDVFKKYRDNAIAGKLKDSGWAEWSVPEKTDCHDIDAWYETNPSLGTVFTERSVEAEISDDELDFNIQRLGLWITYNLKSAISKEDWAKTEITDLPKLKGKMFIGIKYSKDSDNVAMTVACKTNDGKVFISAYDCRSRLLGNGWIIDYLSKLKALNKVVIDGAGAQMVLADDMKDAKLKKPILPTVSEVVRANAEWEQAVYNNGLVHLPQEALDLSVTNCTKRTIGNNGGFGYKSITEAVDICIMDSAILAYWICNNTKEIVQKVAY